MSHTRRMVVSAVAAVLLAGCEPQGPAEQAPARAAADGRAWTPIAAWSGRGSRQSETFTMLRHEWRVRWVAKAEANALAPTLRVSVHSADSGRVLAVPVDREGPGSGTVDVVEEPRQFYLMFESTDVEWSVAVEEAAAAAPDESPRAQPESERPLM